MPIPTVTAVSPATGPPTGGHLIEITGTNFRPPTAPPATGVVPVRPASVRVFFDGVVSPRVLVASDSRIFAETPKRSFVDAEGRPTVSPAAVDVVVENIDDTGVLIPTETVTESAGYTYQQVDISFDNNSDLGRFVDTLIDLWRSEVLPNTVLGQNTDFDSSTGDGLQIVDVAELPAVVLTGPDMSENTFFRTHHGEEVTLVGNEFKIVRRSKSNDLQFSILAITNNDRQLLNLMALIDNFMDNNKFVLFDTVLYEMDFDVGSDMAVVKQANKQLNSNIRTAKGELVVLGFNMSGFAGVVDHDTVGVGAELADVVTLEGTEQVGSDLPPSHGAGRRSPGR